jgi:hypothetical protein
MNRTAESDRLKFPFATDLVTNRCGRITKVVLSLQDYRALLQAVEDAGLYRAMKRVAKEKPLSREAAVALLNTK